jgi:hypothetical protein
MLNHNDSLVKMASERYEQAAADLEKACKAYRKHANSAMADFYSIRMDEAFTALEIAADDLREIRDGYRYTYPHPAALAKHGSRYPVR